MLPVYSLELEIVYERKSIFLLMKKSDIVGNKMYYNYTTRLIQNNNLTVFARRNKK